MKTRYVFKQLCLGFFCLLWAQVAMAEQAQVQPDYYRNHQQNLQKQFDAQRQLQDKKWETKQKDIRKVQQKNADEQKLFDIEREHDREKRDFDAKQRTLKPEHQKIKKKEFQDKLEKEKMLEKNMPE